MSSYAHDADIIVYNYTNRSPTKILGVSPIDTMKTELISLRDAIISIQCNKSKSSPQGAFSVTLKPTRDWAQVITPGSWCSIFMSDRPLTSDDYSAKTSTSTVKSENSTSFNIVSPLKMVGLIMGVRIQKQISSEGITTIAYTISGYDFGYVFTSQIYINFLLQDNVRNNQLLATFSDLSFPTDDGVFADPVINVKRVLSAWSSLSKSKFEIANPAAEKIKPPPIRMQIPDSVAELFGTGTDVLEFITPYIGLDRRLSKVINPTDFKPELIGEKAFHIWRLILHNTMWGMINEYLNPLMNEAYCDLHPVPLVSTGVPLPPGIPVPSKITPALIVRQIPFSTPNYESIWLDSLEEISATQLPFPVTMLNELPKTTISSEKVISFDIGYSEHERCNFAEINGAVINGPQNGLDTGPFATANLPAYNEESIKRAGLRPKIEMGNDYGISRSRLQTAGLWRPLLVDWWFNANKFANGTVECIGLSEHIAIGENIVLAGEEILAHVESYTHTFMVDPNSGNRIFRTRVEFVKGIHTDSDSQMYKYVYGDWDISNLHLTQDSVVGDDAKKRASFNKLGNKGLDIKKFGI